MREGAHLTGFPDNRAASHTPCGAECETVLSQPTPYTPPEVQKDINNNIDSASSEGQTSMTCNSHEKIVDSSADVTISYRPVTAKTVHPDGGNMTAETIFSAESSDRGDGIVIRQPTALPFTLEECEGPVNFQPSTSRRHPSAGWNNSATPQGLRTLVPLRGLMVKQHVEMMEVFTCLHGNNSYEIFDLENKRVFDAQEKTNCCLRNLCCALRPFTIYIQNMSGETVIVLKRPFRLTLKGCPCCLQEVTASGPSGEVYGTVRERCACIRAYYSVDNEEDEPMYYITGPWCVHDFICGCCGVNFRVRNLDGQDIGLITKKWSGILKEAMTEADNFGVKFPPEMDPKMKATMIAATLLIDFMHFEKSGD